MKLSNSKSVQVLSSVQPFNKINILAGRFFQENIKFRKKSLSLDWFESSLPDRHH